MHVMSDNITCPKKEVHFHHDLLQLSSCRPLLRVNHSPMAFCTWPVFHSKKKHPTLRHRSCVGHTEHQLGWVYRLYTCVYTVNCTTKLVVTFVHFVQYPLWASAFRLQPYRYREALGATSIPHKNIRRWIMCEKNKVTPCNFFPPILQPRVF